MNPTNQVLNQLQQKLQALREDHWAQESGCDCCSARIEVTPSIYGEYIPVDKLVELIESLKEPE